MLAAIVVERHRIDEVHVGEVLIDQVIVQRDPSSHLCFSLQHQSAAWQTTCAAPLACPVATRTSEKTEQHYITETQDCTPTAEGTHRVMRQQCSGAMMAYKGQPALSVYTSASCMSGPIRVRSISLEPYERGSFRVHRTCVHRTFSTYQMSIDACVLYVRVSASHASTQQHNERPCW